MTTTDDPATRQRFASLRQANIVRTEGARLRRQIHDAGRHDGAAIAAQIVLDGATGMRFEKLLRTVPGVGPTRAARMLGNARISPMLRVDSWLVDERRRILLADQLRAR